MSANAGEIVACNARLFRLSIVSEIFEIEVRSRPKSRQKACFSAPNFFGGGPSNFGPSFFKLHPCPIMWQSFAAIDRETAEISRWIKKEKRKKEPQNKHKGSRVALSQWAALKGMRNSLLARCLFRHS